MNTVLVPVSSPVPYLQVLHDLIEEYADLQFNENSTMKWAWVAGHLQNLNIELAALSLNEGRLIEFLRMKVRHISTDITKLAMQNQMIS